MGGRAGRGRAPVAGWAGSPANGGGQGSGGPFGQWRRREGGTARGVTAGWANGGGREAGRGGAERRRARPMRGGTWRSRRPMGKGGALFAPPPRPAHPVQRRGPGPGRACAAPGTGLDPAARAGRSWDKPVRTKPALFASKQRFLPRNWRFLPQNSTFCLKTVLFLCFSRTPARSFRVGMRRASLPIPFTPKRALFTPPKLLLLLPNPCLLHPNPPFLHPHPPPVYHTGLGLRCLAPSGNATQGTGTSEGFLGSIGGGGG